MRTPNINERCVNIPKHPHLPVVSSPSPVSETAGYFMGFLAFGRLLRVLFWVALFLSPNLGQGIWTFMVPDVLHTLVMGDYLYQFMKKLKRETVDPVLTDLFFTV